MNRWSVVEYPFRNAVWDSFSIICSSIYSFSCEFKIVENNLEQSSDIVL